MTEAEVVAVAVPTGVVIGWLAKHFVNGKNGKGGSDIVVTLAKIATILDVQTVALARLNESMDDHDRRVAPAVENIPRIAASVEKIGLALVEHVAADKLTFEGINRRLDEILKRRRT